MWQVVKDGNKRVQNWGGNQYKTLSHSHQWDTNTVVFITVLV